MMKKCTNCQTQNSDDSNFCDQCGKPLAAKENLGEQQGNSAVNETRTKDVKKRQPLWIGLIVVAIGIILAIFIFIAFKPSNNQESASKSVQSSTKVSTKSTKEEQSQTQAQATTNAKDSKETVATKEEVENYDAIIKEAKELNIEGKYKESELKLAAIPVSALGKSEYATIKEAAEKLTNSNNEGLQKQKEATTSNATQTQTASASTTFVGDLAKWANTYTFYYSQDGQKQSRLTIAANGGITQSNYDGTQYFGHATIENSSGSMLSYNTDTQYPFRMPSTKMINANVAITIQWDNGGGSQVLYGYLSYSSRLALTDGLNKGGGVNEVWVTY
ncbi:zinc-ribbon domain-containing protein [Enterococcus sp. LJL99]